jgi:putative membrane protein
MSEPSPDINRNFEEPQRVSHKYMPVFFIRNIKSWAILIIIYAIGPLLRGSIDEVVAEFGSGYTLTFMQITLIAIPTVIGLMILFSYLSYRRIRWWMTADDVCIRKGILHRVDKRIPASRIQSVNITESLPERILGVCTLAIDTAGGEGDDGKIPCLEKSVAAFLRDRIFTLKDGAMPPGETTGAPLMETVYKMPVKNLIFAGISGSKAIIFAFIIFGVITQFADIISAIFLRGEDVYDSAWDYIAGLAVPLIILLLISFFIISWAISVLASMAANAGFTIRNVGAKIEIEKGLISHKTASIEKNRIQEVLVRQGFIRKLIGYCEIRVKTAGLNVEAQVSASDAEESLGIAILHPFISMKEAEYFISVLLPDFAGVPKEYAPLPKRARLRSILRWSIWTVVFEAAFWVVLSAYTSSANQGFFLWISEHPAIFCATSAPVLAFFAFLGHLSYKARGIGRNDAFLSVRTGVLGRAWSYVPRRKVQVISLRDNPIQRYLGLTTLEGATGSFAFTPLRDIAKPAGESVLKWVMGQKPAHISADTSQQSIPNASATPAQVHLPL